MSDMCCDRCAAFCPERGSKLTSRTPSTVLRTPSFMYLHHVGRLLYGASAALEAVL